MTRIKIYNNSKLRDSEALILCSELLSSNTLTKGEVDHPKRVTIKFLVEIGILTFHINDY